MSTAASSRSAGPQPASGRSAGVRARWNRAARLARAREGREYDQRCQIPLIFPSRSGRSAERARESAPLSVLQNLAIVADDPVAGCARPRRHQRRRPTRRSRHQHRRRSRAPASPPPNLPTTIPPKRNVDGGQQPQRRPEQIGQVGRPQSSLESARPLARAREGREYD